MFRARVIVAGIMLMLPLSAIVWRMFDIQVLKGHTYAAESKKQAQQRMIIPARRGELRDCKGRVLASSVGGSVKVNVAAFNDDTAALQHGAISLRRVYPYGDAAGAVLGYTGKDGDGLGGAELYFDKFLKGEDGWTIVRRDARNRRYPLMDLPKKEPVNGSDVFLTIDVDIQKIAENVMQQAVASLNAKGGMCIVMEPATGRILAMVNVPTFNPNMPMRFNMDQRLNKCIGYTYEPGSTFKVITTACALQEHVKKETDTINGNHGVFEIYDEKIRDEKPYDKITFADALAFSSNVCFAKVATDIGNTRLYRYARDFGLGDRTGIQLPGEEAGIVHPVDKWSGRTLVTMAIGQEVSVTLLQMTMIFAAVANNGVLCEPRLFDRICAQGGAVIDSTETTPVRRVVSADVAKRVSAMLCGVVNRGTGMKAAVSGIAIAGKTGTAQKIDKESGAYSNTRGWASFIGFATPKDPQLLCAVLIDEPLHAEMGGTAAAPAFSRIVSQIISHPQLQYAERMLQRETPASPAVRPAESGRAVPQLCGMSVQHAADFLTSEKIAYEVAGGGDSIIAQEPQAGNALYTGQSVILHTNIVAISGGSAIRVPDCKGKELRDAVNAVNLRGLVPYVIGSGFVVNQSPASGCFVRVAEACTLMCSFTSNGSRL